MTKAVSSVIALVTAVSLSAAGQTSQPPGQQTPRFQSTVEVTPVDVTVVDDHGRPIRDLTPADFTVRIDGNPRRVVSAEWISLAMAPSATPPRPVPDGYSSNENAAGGRLIVLAVDEPNIRFGAARGVFAAANAFIDHLSPSDRIAVMGLGIGSPSTPFTADRARLKQTISRMVGQKRAGIGMLQFNIALSEALAMANGDRTTAEGVVLRECRNERTPSGMEVCRQAVEAEALQLARDAQQGADQTIATLRALLSGLAGIDAPKTLILMSEGFVMDGTSSLVIELGSLAARARTSLYALLLDQQLFDVTETNIPIAPFADRHARTEGLDTLAGAARGAMFTVVGAGSAIFDRIEAELTGYYLLGVEPDPRDRDGKPHPVRVDVPRRGATVRARRQMVTVAGEAAKAPMGRQAVTAALASPLLSSALPLRLATFSLQGPEPTKIQVLIHADVGTEYTASKRMSVGYTIADKEGRLVDSHGSDVRLAPMVTGVPSSLEYVAGASLAPGDYTLRLAVADGDRTGSIEHPIHAGLVDAAGVRLSELMVGGPADPDASIRPTVGYTVSYGILHAYLEGYGAGTASMRVKYEVATDETSPAILTAEVAPRPAGEGRALFSGLLQVRALPPGKYLLRAAITAGEQPVKTMTRAFELSSPAVLMTSATGLGDDSPSTDGELFLPIENRAFASPFRRDEALKETTLETFRSRLAPEMKEAFDKGVAQLAAGDYIRAEMSFKAAVQPDADSTAALAYLAACFAASGHDTEAASAWQTALVDGSDVPQLYQWLGDALLRTHALAEARSVLEEAVGRWPADARFTRSLAFVYASFGKGREAVRTLERHIGSAPPDADALALGVEWIYQIHAAGGVVHNRTEDVKIARKYAEQYAKANGPKQPLVKQWIDYLEREKR
jgi:VWFA-related protein